MSEFQSIREILNKISLEVGTADKQACEAQTNIWWLRDEVMNLERKVRKCRATTSSASPAPEQTK